MYARLARYDVPEERITLAIEAFRAAGRELKGVEGMRGGYVLTEVETGTLMTMTLWETRAALDASEVRATRLRQEAAEQADGKVASVHCLQIAVDFTGDQ